MQLVVAESRNESRCPLLRAKVKLAGIVTTLKSELLWFLGPGSCHPKCSSPAQEQTRELQTTSLPFCLLLRNLQACSENTLFCWGRGLGFTPDAAWILGQPVCAPAHAFPLFNNRYSGFWMLLLSFGVCMHACVCACVSRCTCGARGQLVGVDFSFCHVRIWTSGGDWGLQVIRPGSR